MQCEKCRAELPPNSISCPECGAPALQTIEGFDNTQHIQLQLKTLLKEHKDALKAAGCRWSSTKKLWSWHHAEDGQRWHKGTKTMAEIRSKYGSTTFARSTNSDALPA